MLYQDAGGGVFVLTLNNPKMKNAMDYHFMSELALMIEHVRRDERCKALVWTGAGQDFCSGAVFRDVATTVPEEVTAGYVEAGLQYTAPDLVAAGSTQQMLGLGKLSISAVAGLAIGGGVNMALVWQDHAVAEEGATFRYPFAELGFVPELGSSMLLGKIVGHRRAKQLLMLAQEFSAREAQEYGLITEVVPNGQALARAVALARKLTSFPQAALRETKRLMRKELMQGLKEATEDELQTFDEVFRSEETLMAVARAAAQRKKRAAKL